jgi:hypothetical protein
MAIKGTDTGRSTADALGLVYRTDFIGAQQVNVNDAKPISTPTRDPAIMSQDAFPGFQLFGSDTLFALDGQCTQRSALVLPLRSLRPYFRTSARQCLEQRVSSSSYYPHRPQHRLNMYSCLLRLANTALRPF